MATIKKRSWRNGSGEKTEVWQLRYRDAKGEERSKQFKKKADAEAYRIKVEGEVVAGVHSVLSTSITVGEACDRFLTERRSRDIEPTTVNQYETHIRLHIKPIIGGDKLAALTMPGVKAFVEALLTSGRSRKMAKYVLTTLRSAIRNAQGDGLVAQNVAVGVSVPTSKRQAAAKSKVYVPVPQELRDILAAAEVRDAKRPGFYPMLLTAVFCGLRSSELRGLRKVDIDLKAATISINQRADKDGIIGPPKSEAGFRTIPIPPMLVNVLRAWLLQCPNGPKGLVFPTSTGGVRLHSNLMNRDYYPTMKAAGVTKLRRNDDGSETVVAKFGIHCLRHAAASSWISRNVDHKRLTTWLGHSSIAITLDTYGHLMVNEEQDAAIARASEAALFG